MLFFLLLLLLLIERPFIQISGGVERDESRGGFVGGNAATDGRITDNAAVSFGVDITEQQQRG